MKMSSHLTGKVKIPLENLKGIFSFILNIKITHQGRKGLSSRRPRRAPARGPPPPPLSRRGRAGQRGRPRGLQRGPARPQPQAPRASRPHSQPAPPAGPLGESRPARPGPPPPPARALKDILLFLPRTKDNKRRRGATYRVRARLRHLLVARTRVPRRAALPSLPPAPARAARAPGSLRGRCRSGAFGVAGPAAPGASDAGSEPLHRPPRLIRGRFAPAGLRTARVQLPAGRGSPRGRDQTPDSSGSCCLSGHLVPCVWCLSPVSSLGFTPSSSFPRPTHHTTWPLRCGGGCSGGRSSAALLSAPLPPPPRLPPAAPGLSAHAHCCPPASAIG